MALKPWYKVITPREDLREGKPLDASEFAVHLDHVRDGRARADYQEPDRFFERTYLTANLKDLAAQVVRRLSGVKVETSAVFNMATQFGGGKTHSLTLLYHLANTATGSEGLEGRRGDPRQGAGQAVPKAATAVFVGTSSTRSPAAAARTARRSARRPGARSPGSSAAQEAFAASSRAREGDDRTRRRRRSETMLPTDRPDPDPDGRADELRQPHRKTRLADQLYNFLHNLSEEARSRNNVVLAVSIPASGAGDERRGPVGLRVASRSCSTAWARRSSCRPRPRRPRSSAAGCSSGPGCPTRRRRPSPTTQSGSGEHGADVRTGSPSSTRARALQGVLPVPPVGAVGVRAEVAGPAPVPADARRAAPAGPLGVDAYNAGYKGVTRTR